MQCPEWNRLIDHYCALVKAYSEAVVELKDAHGTDLDQRREHVDVLRSWLNKRGLAGKSTNERMDVCESRPARDEEAAIRENHIGTNRQIDTIVSMPCAAGRVAF